MSTPLNRSQRCRDLAQAVAPSLQSAPPQTKCKPAIRRCQSIHMVLLAELEELAALAYER
jgi:hypothetical protein